MKTDYCQCLEDSIDLVIQKISTADDLLLRLLFANLITLLEVYLHAVMTSLVNGDQRLLLNVAKAKKFKDRKLPLHIVLVSDPRRYLLQLISEINFHNLSDVEPLFREAFKIRIPLKDEVLQAIKVRHDVIHRDGFTKAGDPVRIDPGTIRNTADSILDLVKVVDQQLMDLQAHRMSVDG